MTDKYNVLINESGSTKDIYENSKVTYDPNKVIILTHSAIGTPNPSSDEVAKKWAARNTDFYSCLILKTGEVLKLGKEDGSANNYEKGSINGIESRNLTKFIIAFCNSGCEMFSQEQVKAGIKVLADYMAEHKIPWANVCTAGTFYPDMWDAPSAYLFQTKNSDQLMNFNQLVKDAFVEKFNSAQPLVDKAFWQDQIEAYDYLVKGKFDSTEKHIEGLTKKLKDAGCCVEGSERDAARALNRQYNLEFEPEKVSPAGKVERKLETGNSTVGLEEILNKLKESKRISLRHCESAPQIQIINPALSISSKVASQEI